MSSSNLSLVQSFPKELRADVAVVVSRLPEVSRTSYVFPVSVSSEALMVPYRIYHDPSLIELKGLTPIQAELLACLLTRHSDGFIREKYLKSILLSMHVWIPPFVVQLVGEYVTEIVKEVRDNLDHLSPALYGSFLRQNSIFYQLTRQRVISYWDCYYRQQRGADYPGFQILEAFDRFIASDI